MNSKVNNNSAFNTLKQSASDFNKRQEVHNAVNSTFMKVLFAQLKAQSPTDPVKSQDFISHMGIMSQVTQSMMTNDKLQMLIDIAYGNAKSQPNLLYNAIGKIAYVEENLFHNNGKVSFIAEAPNDNSNITLELVDANGSITKKTHYKGYELANNTTTLTIQNPNTKIRAYNSDTLKHIPLYIGGKITAVSKEGVFINGQQYSHNKIKIIAKNDNFN